MSGQLQHASSRIRKTIAPFPSPNGVTMNTQFFGEEALRQTALLPKVLKHLAKRRERRIHSQFSISTNKQVSVPKYTRKVCMAQSSIDMEHYILRSVLTEIYGGEKSNIVCCGMSVKDC